MTGPVRRAALFLAGLAALLAAASVYYEVRVRRGDFFRQVQWFMDPGVQPSVLFVGDSRLAANVLGSHLPAGFYNWSYPGETLRQSYLRVRYALETKPRLRYLVLGLDDLTLSEPRARQREVADHLLFADLADVLEVYPGSVRFLLRAAGLFHFPLVNAANRRRLGQALVEDATRLLTGEAAPQPTQFVDGDIRFGWRSDWPYWPREVRSARTARHVRDLLGGRNDTSELRAVLDKIVVLAERHGVKVIGLRSPLSAEYRRHAQSYDIGSVLAAYDHAPLHAMLDYARYLSDRTDYFQDGDHLNDLGAAVFTRRVARDLRGIAPDAAVAASIGRTAPAPRPPALFWPYNDVISPWLRELACTRRELGCEPAPSVPTQVAAAQPGAFDGPGNGGQSVMQQADTYFWAGVLLLGLLLAWWTIAQAPRQPGSFAARPRRMAELNLAISANRIEAARGIIAAQLALLRRQRPEEPPEFAVLRSCPASTIELFRRLTSQSHIIFDSRDARAASDAWTLHDLGLAVVKQRLPTEIEIGLSSTAMELLDRQRERALKEWSARNAQERVAAMEHPAG